MPLPEYFSAMKSFPGNSLLNKYLILGIIPLISKKVAIAELAPESPGIAKRAKKILSSKEDTLYKLKLSKTESGI